MPLESRAAAERTAPAKAGWEQRIHPRSLRKRSEERFGSWESLCQALTGLTETTSGNAAEMLYLLEKGSVVGEMSYIFARTFARLAAA